MSALAYAKDSDLESRMGGFDRRVHQRKDISLDGTAFSTPNNQTTVKLVDISASGCRLLDSKGELSANQCVTFSLNGEIVVEGMVRWSGYPYCGVEFLDPLPEQIIASVS